MGRGRQKAKQTKIARKLKYLTTDTNYDELAKELSGREPDEGHTDPFTMVEAEYGRADSSRKVSKEAGSAATPDSPDATVAQPAPVDDDLDDYARWAAEAAAKATSGEMPVTPKPHKRIPIPVPSIMGHHAPKKTTTAKSTGKTASKAATGTKAASAKATAVKTSESKSTAGKAKAKASSKVSDSKSAASKTASKASSKSGTGTSSATKSVAGKKSTVASKAPAKKASTKESGTKKAGTKKAR